MLEYENPYAGWGEEEQEADSSLPLYSSDEIGYEPVCYQVVIAIPSYILDAREQSARRAVAIPPPPPATAHAGTAATKSESYWHQAATRERKQGWTLGLIGAGFVLLLLAISSMGHLASPSSQRVQHLASSSSDSVVSQRSGDYTVTVPNELSPQRIDAILAYYGSPVVGEGQDIYDLGQQYGIDDIFFLADYRKESSFGRSTLASAPNYNPTGMECSDLAQGCTGADGNGRNWGTWTSYRNGYEAWFKQISQRYVSGLIDGGYKLTTIWLIACGPNGTGMYDGGSGCNQYAADIQGWVDSWRAGKY